MTTEKQPYEPDDADRTQALPPVDPTVELPVTPREPGEPGREPDERDAVDADATQVVAVEHDDPDATQVIEAHASGDLADELFRAEATQALPVAPSTQALPVSEPTLALPVAPPSAQRPTGERPASALPVWEASTHTQAYPVQDAPVDPEPGAEEGPATAATPSPAPSAAVDPAAQWNATAQHKAQHPDPALVEDPRNRGLRVGTVVWGFVIVAVGAGILALALGATYDLDLALIGLLSVAGLVLVVGSIVSSSRRSARERASR